MEFMLISFGPSVRILAVEASALFGAAFSRPRTDAVGLLAEAHFAVAARVFFLEPRNLGLSQFPDFFFVLDCIFAVSASAIEPANHASAKALAVEFETARATAGTEIFFFGDEGPFRAGLRVFGCAVLGEYFVRDLDVDSDGLTGML